MSKLSLDPYTVEWVLNHIIKHGDTDIYPAPLEMEFFAAQESEIASYISEIDLNTYHPKSLLEALAFKSKFSLRLAHQLFPVDTIILTAAIVTIANDLESSRNPITEGKVWSYRFFAGREHDFFSPDRRYKDWLKYQNACLAFDDKTTTVVKTDISDFYLRIYHHRLENCLRDYTKNSPYARFIFRMIKQLRGKLSYGIPVGTNAARLLAEIILNDTDTALENAGYQFSRYVDDFVIFLNAEQEPNAVLAFLAEQLATNEGLTLSAAKTRVYPKADYIEQLNVPSSETTDEAEELATEALYWRVYDSESSDIEALKALQHKDIVGELDQELNADHWDMGKIRVYLRALRLLESDSAEQFIRSRFKLLVPFAKDVIGLMDELDKERKGRFENMAGDVIELASSPALQSLPLSRAWLMELFVRQIVPITALDANKLSYSDNVLNQRQMHLIRRIAGDLSFFRRGKNRLDEFSEWLKPSFIYGASCLPEDEFTTWVNGFKNREIFPLSRLFCEWTIKVNANSRRSANDPF